MSAWIAVRGTEDGPLFRPVNKGGRVIAGGMSLRAIGKRVQTQPWILAGATIPPHFDPVHCPDAVLTDDR